MRIALIIFRLIVLLATIASVGYMSVVCMKQLDRIDELEVFCEVQSKKITQLTEELHQDNGFAEELSSLKRSIGRLVTSVAKLQSKDSETDEMLDSYDNLKESVENIAHAVYGDYPCNDTHFRLRSIITGTLVDAIPEIKSQIKDLSNTVYGEYPHAECHTSILLPESLKKQVDDLKRKVEILEIEISNPFR